MNGSLPVADLGRPIRVLLFGGICLEPAARRLKVLAGGAGARR